MGCGSSKGVAPAPAALAGAGASPLKDTSDQQPADVAALHKQRLQQQHSHNAQQHTQPQGDLSLLGRIKSSTAPVPPALNELPEVQDLPPLHKDPGAAAADAEFDYGKELQRGAALGGGGSSPAQGGSAVVGGLLSKQPDWLRGSGNAGSSISNADSPTAASAAKLPRLDAAGAGPAPAQALPGLKATSALPPLIGWGGLGASAASPAGGSLPPVLHAGAAGRAVAPAGAQHKLQEEDGAARAETGAEAAGSNNSRVSEEGAGAAGGRQHQRELQDGDLDSSRSGSPSPHTASTAAQGHSHAGPADPWNSLQRQYAHAGGSPSPDNSMTGSPPPAAAVAQTAAATAAPAGGSSLPPLHGSSGAAQGPSRRTTATAKQQQQRQSRELVLVDSDEEEAASVGPHPHHQQPHQQQQQQQEEEKGVAWSAAARASRSSFSSSGGSGEITAAGAGSRALAGRLSAQSSQRSVSSGVPGPHVAKSGGWGVGSLAGAGTIMLGDEPAAGASSSSRRAAGAPQVTPAAAAAAAAAGDDDDVFGDSGDGAVPALPRGVAAGLADEASSTSAAGGGLLRASHSRVRVGGGGGLSTVPPPAAAAAAAAPPLHETLDVEEIEDDVDAMIEAELGRDGLPADLAAKLAQFEAGGGGDSEEGAESEGPSIYAMMNNRQGSWRAG